MAPVKGEAMCAVVATGSLLASGVSPGDPTRYQPPREPHGCLICRCQSKWRLTAFLLQVTTSHLSGFVLLRVLGSYCLYTGKLLTSMY